MWTEERIIMNAERKARSYFSQAEAEDKLNRRIRTRVDWFSKDEYERYLQELPVEGGIGE